MLCRTQHGFEQRMDGCICLFQCPSHPRAALQGLDNLEVLMIQDNCIGTLDDLSLDLLVRLFLV